MSKNESNTGFTSHSGCEESSLCTDSTPKFGSLTYFSSQGSTMFLTCRKWDEFNHPWAERQKLYSNSLSSVMCFYSSYLESQYKMIAVYILNLHFESIFDPWTGKFLSRTASEQWWLITHWLKEGYHLDIFKHYFLQWNKQHCSLLTHTAEKVE